MFNKKWVVIMVSLCFLMIATACGSEKSSLSNSEANTPEKQNKSDAPVVPTIDKPVKLTVYHEWGMTTEVFMNLYGKYIVKKYPNVTIEMLNESNGTLNELILTGVNVDLIIHVESGLSIFKELGLDSDLSDLIKKYNYDLNQWVPSVAKYIQEFNDGKIPAIPFTLQTIAFYYNKSLFSKFGLPEPTDNMTWDEVKETAVRMTREDGGVLYRGYDTLNYGNKFTLNPLSMAIIDPKTDKAAFETDQWKKYLDKMISLVKIPGFEPAKGDDALDVFIKEERIAMTSTMSTNFVRFTQNPSLDWDVANYPSYDGLPGVGPQPEIIMFYIPSNSKNKEAAFLAAAEITSPEVQRELSMAGDMAVLKDPEIRNVFGSNLPELKGKNVKALMPVQFANKTPYNKYTNVGTSQLGEVYRSVITNTKDINTALREAAELANKKIEELKQTE